MLEVLAGALLLCGWLACGRAQVARADEPTLVIASVLYESPALIIPVLRVVLRGDGDEQLRLQQTGWTSGVEWLNPLSAQLSFVASAELTPVFAHYSNRMYANGERAPWLEWRDTSFEMNAGYLLRAGPFVQADCRLAVLKEWVAELAPPEQASVWQQPFGGVQAGLAARWVRSDELLRMRWEGVKAQLDGQLWSDGERIWGRARLELGAGRKLGPLFFSAHAFGFLVSIDNRVALEPIGGSWDELRGVALHGHPYAEFRSSSGAAGQLALDWQLLPHWELGVRGSVFISSRERGHGQALMTRVILEGVTFVLGLATPDAEAFRGTFDSLQLIAAISAATFVL